MPALIDGNNFYVSCKRVLQPKLQGRPVVVLSNNDCAIARSDEIQFLGIKTSAPCFQLRELKRAVGGQIYWLDRTLLITPQSPTSHPPTPLAAKLKPFC